MKRNILLTPGPLTTTKSVKDALVVPDICPREKEFSKLIKSIRDDLIKLAGGNKDYTCVLFGASGTGAMEACMGSIIPQHSNSTALVISNGLYGERFSIIANILGIKNQKLDHVWGQPIILEKLEGALSANPNISTVFMTHHETTTGILNNINEVSKLTKKYKVPLVADCISSFGAIPLNIQESNIDFIISTSNKCLQGMPGISFVICKKEALKKLSWNARSYYFDLSEQYKFMEEKKQFRFTPPVQVLYALRQAINELLKEGIDNRYKRYSKNYKILVEGMSQRGFRRYLSNSIPQSKLIVTFLEPEGFDFKEFHDKLYKKGFIVYPGILKEKTFRLGCMGDLLEDDIENFLKAVDEIET